MPKFGSELKKLLGDTLREQSCPGGGPYLAVSLKGIKIAAKNLGCSSLEAMQACLAEDIWPLRFCRNRGLFSASEQVRLLQSHAAFIGCGGLGGYDLTLLARLGLGNFTVCDYDSFSESNLNRQCLCREDRLGMNKALAAESELSLIASHVQVRAFPCAATDDNLPQILAGTDVVVDGLDNMKSRNLVAKAAHKAGIPFIYASLAGEEGLVLLDDGQKYSEIANFYGGEDKHSSMAEDQLGVPSLTPPAVAILQCLMAVRSLLRTDPTCGDSDESKLWHIDLSIPEIEHLFL